MGKVAGEGGDWRGRRGCGVGGGEGVGVGGGEGGERAVDDGGGAVESKFSIPETSRYSRLPIGLACHIGHDALGRVAAALPQ